MLNATESAFSLSTANTQPCYAGGPATLICKAALSETHDSKTFVFEDKQGRSFDFKPGQYVTFRFDIDGKVHVRAYSISSTPTRPHNIQVTVKRVEGGVVSNYLNDCLKPGEEVEVADISGHFNWVDAYHDKPLFLSGGSGVTPVMSMLQYLTDVTAPRDIVFVHFAKTPKDIIFRDQLEFLAKRFDNVTVHLVISQPDEQDWDGETGRISAELLQKLVPDHAERGVFLCGPEGFMKAARDAAKDISFAAFNEESFGEKITLTKTKGTGGEVFFSQSGLNGQCAPHETLLEAALNTGVWIDSACQQGVCGNCKVLVTQGEVEMQDMGGLMPGEAEAGYVLACCSRPKGAVAIEA